VTICTSDYRLDRMESFNFKVYKSWLNLSGIHIMPAALNLKVENYDVLHFQCYRSFLNAVLYYKAIKYGVPYVIDAHGSTVDMKDFRMPLRQMFDSVIGYEALKHAHKLIAETEIGVKEYERLGVASDRVTLLHPLFDTSEFTNLPARGLFRKKYNIENKYIVLFIGRIHWAKGIEFLVESIRALAEDIKLVIMGQDDGYKAQLMKIISQSYMDKDVLFTGYLNGQDKLSALVDADVLVQPSKNEAGARPSLEAILCGIPVIVTKDNGAGREIDKMDAGCLVDYGDAEQLGQAISFVLQKKAETYIQVQKARKYIEGNLSLGKQVEVYERLYK
jgi:glycosyltransferase involved in cell wall biosynthesis